MIRVQNVYYMLAYAFQVLHEQGYKNVATEEFDNVAELLSAILCRGVSVQIKRGLIRQYISREEALASPRGKLEIGESIKTQVIRKKQLICNYDEFSVDAYPNRIIKTTMDLLLRGSISKARKKEIRKLMIFFDGISILDIHSINWDIQYDRNNQTYRMLIAVCRFVIKGLLQTTADGSTKIMDYADDQTMAKLYEKFILGYYQREHPELKAYSPQIAWKVTDGYRTLLPTMQSDIVITNKAAKKTLIIDAKYYTHNMQMKASYHEVINSVIRRTKAQPEKQYYSHVGDVIIPTSGETPEEISTAACVMLPDIILAGDLNIFRSSKIDGRIMSCISGFHKGSNDIVLLRQNCIIEVECIATMYLQCFDVLIYRCIYFENSERQRMFQDTTPRNQQ